MAAEDEAEFALKLGDDETNVEFFRRIRGELAETLSEEKKAGLPEPRLLPVKNEKILVSNLVEWLRDQGVWQSEQKGQEISEELIVDEVLHELVIAEWQNGGSGTPAHKLRGTHHG